MKKRAIIHLDAQANAFTPWVSLCGKLTVPMDDRVGGRQFAWIGGEDGTACLDPDENYCKACLKKAQLYMLANTEL